ncbi:MAG: CBS domain-containing protein, partial [Burkholderiales bacterium]|nr:CBS domain-containing protein [Burkholderiales bacterium]
MAGFSGGLPVLRTDARGVPVRRDATRPEAFCLRTGVRCAQRRAARRAAGWARQVPEAIDGVPMRRSEHARPPASAFFRDGVGGAAQTRRPMREQELRNPARRAEARAMQPKLERSAAMNVSKVMTQDVRLANPGQTIHEVAQIMAEIGAGALPVAEEDRLRGMITDRDIVIRAIAAGKGPDTRVEEVMTPGTKYCFEDEEVGAVAETMAKLQVRRLPVL